jgi:hypothetical protein
MTDTEAPAGLTTSNSRLNVAINEVPQIASAIIATCGTYVATRQEIAARYAEYEIEITWAASTIVSGGRQLSCPVAAW